MISPPAQVITLGKNALFDTFPILTTKDNVVYLHQHLVLSNPRCKAVFNRMENADGFSQR